MHSVRKMKIIVAMDVDAGIGKNGTLPWKLKRDMQFFVETTTRVNDASKRNAIVMGRKCWESIPDQRKPLHGRLNVVLSRTLPEKIEKNVIFINDFDKMINLLSSEPYYTEIETIWNIGGAEIYAMALKQNLVSELYVTHIYKKYDTDVNLSSIDFSKYEKLKLQSDENAPRVFEENGERSRGTGLQIIASFVPISNDMVKQKNQKKLDAEKNANTVNTTNITPTTTTVTTSANTGANSTGGSSHTTTSAYSSSSSTNRNNTTVVNTNPRPQTQQHQPKRDREKSASSNQGNSYRKSNNTSDNRGSRDYNKERNNSHYLSTNGNNSKNKNRDNSSHSRRGGNSNYYSSNSSLANSVTSNGVSQQPQNVETKRSDSRKTTNNDENKIDAWSTDRINAQEQGTGEENLQNKENAYPIQQSFFSPTTKFRDTVLSYIECGDWDRVELICELVALLDAFDLRLVFNCIEASQRTYSAQLKPMEKRANSLDPMFLFPAPDDNFHQYYGDGRLVIESPSSSSSASEVSAAPVPSVSSKVSTPKDSKISTKETISEGEKTTEKKKVNAADEKMGQIAFEKPNELAEALYINVALCESTNRKSAHLISLYVEAYCMTWREYHLAKISDINDRIKVLETMGKVVSACLHHPAFSVSDKMKYAHARDQIRNEYDQMIVQAEITSTCPGTVDGCKYTSDRGVGDVDTDDEISEVEKPLPHVHHLSSASSTVPVQKSNPGSFVYIQRFIGKHLEDDDQFQIEIHWSDNDQTFTCRSREQLKVLQHRLLDEFGQQQRSDVQKSMTISTNSDDEQQLSTSTSSDLHTSSGRRILPRLNHDASPAEVVQYINELSDMPARMMLSRAICEEFNATRNKTIEDDIHADGVSLSRWRPPPSVPTFPRMTTPVTTTSNYAVTFSPMMYGAVPQNQIQVFQTTCSTCAGAHSYLFCPDLPILDRKKYLDDKGAQTNKPTSSPVPPHQSQYSYQGPDGTHFTHHQNLFMQQQQRYGPPHMAHMYDPNQPIHYFNAGPNLSFTNVRLGSRHN